MRLRGRPKNSWKIDLEKEMWTARYKNSWRKMEAAAQDRAEDREDWFVTAYVPSTGTDKATVKQLK